MMYIWNRREIFNDKQTYSVLIFYLFIFKTICSELIAFCWLHDINLGMAVKGECTFLGRKCFILLSNRGLLRS